MAKLDAVREDGQKEYAHEDDRPFRNMEKRGEALGIPRELVGWVYLMKHMGGILAHIKGHRSQREPIEGRFKDAHMYLYLIEFMLVESDGSVSNLEQTMLNARIPAPHDTDGPGIAGGPPLKFLPRSSSCGRKS